MDKLFELNEFLAQRIDQGKIDPGLSMDQVLWLVGEVFRLRGEATTGRNLRQKNGTLEAENKRLREIASLAKNHFLNPVGRPVRLLELLDLEVDEGERAEKTR